MPAPPASLAPCPTHTHTPPPPPKSHCQDFYEDAFLELAKHGELEYLCVCDNLADHMVGNVYAKFRRVRGGRKVGCVHGGCRGRLRGGGGAAAPRQCGRARAPRSQFAPSNTHTHVHAHSPHHPTPSNPPTTTPPHAGTRRRRRARCRGCRGATMRASPSRSSSRLSQTFASPRAGGQTAAA